MNNLWNTEKKIVYWGVGKICNYCLQQYPDICPAYFIDSHQRKSRFDEKLIKCPDDIDDWFHYYVVITVKSGEIKREIQDYLIKKGLQRGKDFCTYEEFFGCTQPTVTESINLVEKYMAEFLETENPVMFKIPIIDIRHNKDFIKFLSSYMMKREYSKNMVFSNLKVINSELASMELNCPVFYIPNIYEFEITKQIRDGISEETYNWLEKLEFRKSTNGKDKGINESIKIYYYYRAVIELIKPSKIIIWGSWTKENYILGYLADYYNIPHRYMEYGWIPGTYQVDPRGIAGQSEYAVNSEIFNEIEVENIYNIEQIKLYVRESKVDTRTFIDTEEDNAALSGIDKNRKTIFLVGMDDKGMCMNPKSNYWKKYISNIVDSTEEALLLLSSICKKNNWNLIFKPHPGNSVSRLEILKNVIFVRNAEIDKLIKLADVVVSIVSAVDYKTLIYEKPLVQLGITTLLGKDCSYTVFGKTMLEEQILLALENGMTKKQIENFNRLLQILLQRYLWDDMSERSIRYGLTMEQDFL